MRTRRIHGAFYSLVAVGGRSEIYGRAQALISELRVTGKAIRRLDPPATVVDRATKDQVERWAELTAYRDPPRRPLVLWVRQELR